MGYIWVDNGLFMNNRKERSEVRPFQQPVRNGRWWDLKYLQ